MISTLVCSNLRVCKIYVQILYFFCEFLLLQIPIIDNFKEKMGDVVNVIKVDIDQERELADKYRIQSVPTIMIFKNGEVMWRGSGLQSHTDLMVALNGVEWR